VPSWKGLNRACTGMGHSTGSVTVQI
jgi:hypothetical protein